MEERWDEMGLRGEKGVRDGEEKVECKLPFNKHNKVSLPDGDQSQLAILGTFLSVSIVFVWGRSV